MSRARRWDCCVNHRGKKTEEFVRSYFGDPRRRVLLVAGAGFDPRSCIVCGLVSNVMGDRAQGLFIREDRPNPDGQLVERAQRNQAEMGHLIPGSQVVHIDVFAPDGAVIGARSAARTVNDYDLSGITDVIIDFSALSIGIAFPITRLLFDRLHSIVSGPNLHLMITDEPRTDAEIIATASDTASSVHGFKGGLGLDSNARAAKIWFPQLIRGRRAVLERILAFIQQPNPEDVDVCPILPFPASEPRLADELVEHYGQEFESVWEVDARDVVYVDEKNPLDLYRTILRVDDTRSRVFSEVGGSLIVLSPIGSKVAGLGALMAAIERDFPVVYVEAVGYTVDYAKLDERRSGDGEVVHVWLHGEAYA